MNINQLYKYIGAISEQIPLVHSYSNKSVYDYWNMDEVKYGSVCFSVQNVSAGSHTTTYTGILYYGDRLVEDRSNIESVYSDATLALQTIINTLSNSDDVEITFPIQITYFEQEFADQLAGAYANLTITVEGVGQCGFDGTILPTPIYPGEDGFDAENYYTKSQVDALLDRYDAIVDEKLEGYAKDTELASYVTKTELEEKGYIDHIPTNLVTESELNETLVRKGYLTHIPDEYITGNELDEKLQKDGYTTKSQVNALLDGYVSESELVEQDYATKVYVSQRVANVEDTLTGFASKSYVDAAIDKCVSESELVEQDFVTKSQVNALLDGYVSESELMEQGYATKDYVSQRVANVEDTLTGFASKSYVDAAIDKCVSESELVEQDFTTKSQVNALLDGYVSKSALVEQGYATKEYVKRQVTIIEDGLVDFATKSYVDAEIDKIQAGDVDLSDYYTKTESNNRFATKAYVAEEIAKVQSGGSIDLSGYVTDQELEDALKGVEVDLSGYYTKSQTDAKFTTKTYVDEKVANVEIDLTGYATKAYVAEEIAKVQSGGSIDLSGYVTDQELEDALKDVNVDLTGYATESYVSGLVGDINSILNSVLNDI